MSLGGTQTLAQRKNEREPRSRLKQTAKEGGVGVGADQRVVVHHSIVLSQYKEAPCV